MTKKRIRRSGAQLVGAAKKVDELMLQGKKVYTACRMAGISYPSYVKIKRSAPLVTKSQELDFSEFKHLQEIERLEKIIVELTLIIVDAGLVKRKVG